VCPTSELDAGEDAAPTLGELEVAKAAEPAATSPRPETLVSKATPRTPQGNLPHGAEVEYRLNRNLSTPVLQGREMHSSPGSGRKLAWRQLPRAIPPCLEDPLWLWRDILGTNFFEE